MLVHDHLVICTVCGDTLGPTPQRTRANASSSLTGGARAIPEFMTEDFRQAGREFRTVISNMREQIQGVYEGDGWQEVPAEILAPQSTAHKGRPTAKETLAKIPRVVLDDKSSLFRQASLELSCPKLSILLNFTCIPAEFGPAKAFEINKATVVVASPRTAKGGLSKETKTQIERASNPVVYLERGDGITFVSKALQSQRAGAIAVIIGNSMSTPWPYVMKDSSDEAIDGGLTIPVVMINEPDGKALIEYYEKYATTATNSCVFGRLSIQSLTKDCAVCCDIFRVKEIVMSLPSCGHLFHEKCAVAWLTAHNTCPFCRRELPTDDVDYEQERRRAQRTHAGSSSRITDAQWSGYYG